MKKLYKKSKVAIAVAGKDGKEEVIVVGKDRKEEVILTEKNISTELDDLDVLVRVKACGLSCLKDHFFGDILKVANSKSVGTDISGVVEGVGSDVTEFKVGDNVAGIVPLDYQQSGCGEYVRLHECDLVVKPTGVTFVDAAAVVGDGVRAYLALYSCTKLNQADVVLVLNGAAPCASICIQLAHNVGAKVLATCTSRDEKLFLERTLGSSVDEVIDLSNEYNVPEKLYNVCMRSTDNLGVNLIVDIEENQHTVIEEMSYGSRCYRSVGIHVLISCLSVGGRWITTNASLQLDPPDSKNLLLRSGSVCFVNEQAWMMSGRQEDRDMYQSILKTVMAKLEDGSIKSFVHHTIGFPELPETMKSLLKHNVGKVVLLLE